MAYRVNFTARAVQDLDTIYQYIQADTSTAAARWFNRLVAAVESLSQFPQRNPAIVEDPELRHLLYGNKPHIYRIIYSIDHSKKVVTIIHIRHGAQDTFEPPPL